MVNSLMKLLPVVLILALSGCAVGPDYRRPTVVEEALTEAWRNPTPTEGQPLALAQWWSLFDDSTLTALVEHAQKGSPTVAEAAARLMQARGLAGESEAASLPVMTLQGQPASRQDTGAGVTVSRSMGVAVSWELDVFGAARRDREAANARSQGAWYSVKAAQVALASDVASAYFSRRNCEGQLDLNAQDIQARRTILSLTQAKERAGTAAPADVAKSKASVAESEGQRLVLLGTCDRTFNQLVALTGDSATALAAALGSGAGPTLPQYAVRQVPANLLSHRADVRSAEMQLMAASAGIGVAQADMYPRLTLSGMLSSVQMGASGGPLAALRTWSFASSLTAPLFDGGRRHAAVSVAEGKYNEALASYQGQVRTAVREVEDALSKVATARAQHQVLGDAEAQYAQSFKITGLRYKAGAASLLEVEDARRSLLSARLASLNALTDQYQAHVALYRALGGGWSETTLFL